MNPGDMRTWCHMMPVEWVVVFFAFSHLWMGSTWCFLSKRGTARPWFVTRMLCSIHDFECRNCFEFQNSQCFRSDRFQPPKICCIFIHWSLGDCQNPGNKVCKESMQFLWREPSSPSLSTGFPVLRQGPIHTLSREGLDWVTVLHPISIWE